MAHELNVVGVPLDPALVAEMDRLQKTRMAQIAADPLLDPELIARIDRALDIEQTKRLLYGDDVPYTAEDVRDMCSIQRSADGLYDATEEELVRAAFDPEDVPAALALLRADACPPSES